MSRSDTRSDAIRTLTGDAGARDTRPGVGQRLSAAGNALKRDALEFLNTAEYEFRKVVGASRSMPSPHEPDQAPTRETAHGRKPAPETPGNDRE